jgi:transposase
LPRYAPEPNPDEHIWNYLKRNGTAKRPLAEGEKLRHRVAADLLAITRCPSLVRSFFHAPSVAHIDD